MAFAERLSPTGSFLGTYEVLRRLATGGMADVFLARQPIGGRSDRLVVIKSILQGLADRPEFVTMFMEEAHVAAQLQHPHIVQILDVSMLGNRPCMIMEYLNGVDAAWIYRRMAQHERPLSPVATAALAVGAAYGLGYAHRKAAIDGTPLRIVHRDVSPHNVFVTRDGIVKILDFGIARTSQQIHTTQAGVLKGKIPYMSPEQMASQPIDGRADLFGLGVVMWELVTGKRLFRRETEVQSMQAVLFEPIPRPSDARPGIPEELDAIICRALERTVERRPESGEALARELERFLQHQQAEAPHVVLARLLEEIATPGELDPVIQPASLVRESDPGARSEHMTPEVTPPREPTVGSVTSALGAGPRARRTWAWAALLGVALAGGLAWALARPASEPTRAPRPGTGGEVPEPDALTEQPAPPVVPLEDTAATTAAPAAARREPHAPAKVRQKVVRPAPPGLPAPASAAAPATAAGAAPAAPPHPGPRTPPASATPPSPRSTEPAGTGVSLDSEYR